MCSEAPLCLLHDSRTADVNSYGFTKVCTYGAAAGALLTSHLAMLKHAAATGTGLSTYVTINDAADAETLDDEDGEDDSSEEQGQAQGNQHDEGQQFRCKKICPW